MPEVPTVATDGVAELHVPPVVALVSVITLPLQTVEGPPIAAGIGWMVIVAVA
jgi:hypothetical protein